MKKAFNLSRDSVYVADPIDDLRIIGAKGILSAEEAGPLDTEAEEAMPLRDLRRLRRALPGPFAANIATRGVNVPIIIVKIDDVAVVVEGKSRVRAARAANRERKKAGEPLLKIKCVIQRDNRPLALLATMVSSNNARMEDDFLDKLEKLKSYLDLGGSEADAALHFGVQQQTIRGWLAFDDQATDETKAAVKEGRLGSSAAAELARIKDPDEQRVKLQTMLTAPDKKGRSVKAARAARGGAKNGPALTGKRTQKRVLASVQAMSHAKHGEKTIAFWEGVEETLKWLAGDEHDARLDALVE
jgi:hypothetical protein